MRIIKEDIDVDSFDVHIYEDTTTGIKYIYKNGRLVPMPEPDFEEEDKEREERIKKEYEEAKKRGLNVKQETPEEKEERIKRIQAIMADEKEAKAFAREAKIKITRNTSSIEDVRRMNQGKYDAQPISEFEPSIRNFIAKQVASKKERSYRKLNKKYAHTSLVKPGSRKGDNHVPLLCVYLDRSGSWSEKDTAIAERVIDSLAHYVQQGKLKIKMIEFASNLREYGSKEYIGGGTNGEGVIQHIIDNNPDNVVVMTDGDCRSGFSKSVTVPGGVWLIFKQTESYESSPEEVWVNRAYIDSIHGERLNEVFKIPYGEDGLDN